VRVWRLADGAPQTLGKHALNVWSVAFSGDARWIASGSFDRTVKLWRADTGALARTLSGHAQAVVDLAFSPDSRLLATGSDDASVMLWNVSDGSVVQTLTEGSEHVYAVAFSPNGKWLASGGREKGALGTLWRQIAGDRPGSKRDPTVRLWKVADGSLQQALAAHTGDVHSVAFSADGKWLASAGEDGLVRLWRLTELE
jgi:WD40 repeat protein